MSNENEVEVKGKEAVGIMVSTTATGAAIGATVGGPVGAAVGGVGGAIAGAAIIIAKEGKR